MNIVNPGMPITAPVLDIKHVVVGPEEHAAITAVLDSRDLSGNAAAVAGYEAALSGWFATRHAVACSSGTAALHLALLALGIGGGDEVIVAATAPVMTVLPVLAVGAAPVFADTAAPDTFALDKRDVAEKITSHTRAVIAVPMWGYPADRADLVAACGRWGLYLIEDAAQAHGTVVDGRLAGTGVTIGTFSTHVRKILTTGEGGFCLTDDRDLDRRMRQIRNLGQPPVGGPFGTSFGLNFKLGALAAALGTAQLGRLRARIDQRRQTLSAIKAIATALPDLRPFPAAAGCAPNGYAALFTSDRAAAVAERLAAGGINSDPQRYGYQPVYRTPALADRAPRTPCPNAERLTTSLITIPCHEGITAPELERIRQALMP